MNKIIWATIFIVLFFCFSICAEPGFKGYGELKLPAKEQYYYNLLKDRGIIVVIFDSDHACENLYFEELLKEGKEVER